jgi:glycolate oxidase iron-sulfur subunit
MTSIESGQPTTITTERRARAFDERRPPEPELIDDCVHCGFCLPTCPTYVLWGEEMDSPRGRIVLMKEGLEEADELSPSMVTHLDRCLGCMACVTACPSGVRYDRLIEATRPQIERNYTRPAQERALRRVLFGLFTRPGRLRVMVPLVVAARRAGIARAATRLPGKGLSGALRSVVSLAPSVSLSEALRRLPEATAARGTRRGRVGLLQGCVQRVFFGRVNEATRRVLAAEGFEVVAPSAPRCCGALMFHTGYEDEALALAKVMFHAFEDCDWVVTNAAGCGSSMKDYAHVLADDPEWGERARAFSEKVRDVTELLAEHEPRALRHPLPLRVAYHDACHLAHAQGVRSQPRELLRAIPELDLAEPAEWEVCCGSAGLYNLLQPEAGEALGRRKAHNLLATKPDVIAAGNPGCILQIARYVDGGERVRLVHPIEILDASIAGRRL